MHDRVVGLICRHALSATAVAAVFAWLSTPCGAGAHRWSPKHPVLDHHLDPAKAADYEGRVNGVMAMTDAQLLSFVPDKPFAAYCECPRCYGGVEGNHVFTWTVDRPNEMKCRFCGAVYPDSAFPEDHVLTGTNRLGETITYHYYLNGKTHVRHFLTANLARWKREWVVRQCEALGRAYQATGKEEYARKVVLILDRIAEVYPHYPVMRNSPRAFAFRKSQEPPFPWDSGRWGYFHNEIPRTLVRAYDLVYDSPEFARLSKQRGYQVRRRVEEGFLRQTFAAVAAKKDHVSNVVGYDVTTAAVLGRVLGEPRYVHWAFEWMKRNVQTGFFYDGWWHESPSYHYMTIGGLKSAFAQVRGYSDPPGYRDPTDGTRFDDLDPDKVLPFWAKCRHAPSALDFPDGTSPVIHDTWSHERRSQPRRRTVSTIAPGFGHASLGRGVGANQMQAQLHFSGAYGHAHLDNLNLTLWAKGREMLSDLGYTWTQMRYWCTCTLGHNLVVVDRKDQVSRGSDGNLLWFFPDVHGLAAVEADGRRAYANIAGLDRYRRLLVLVPVSEADAYVVDVFRVRGGAVHDWTIHGDADRDMTATCTLPLVGNRKTMLETGEQWTEPTREGARFNPYGMLRELATAATETGVTTEFVYAGEPTRGVRIHVLPGGKEEVWLGRSPSVRRAGVGSRGDMRKSYDFWMPHLLVRRRGKAPLASTFVAVYEPFSGKRFLAAVKQLPVTPAGGSAYALRVTHGAGNDTIIATLDEPPYPERRAGSVTLRGRLGVVRETGGRATALWLLEGIRLSRGEASVTSAPASYSGVITAATRKVDGAPADAFLTTAKLPPGNELHGRWLIVTHGNGLTHGYEIDRIETAAHETTIVLADDHGLRITPGKTTEVYFPHRGIAGKNTFVIPLAAARVTGK